MALVLDVLTAIDERSLAQTQRDLEHRFEEGGHEAGERFGTNLVQGITAGFHRGDFESLTGVLGSAGMAAKAAGHGEAIGLAFAGGITAAAGAALVHLGVEVGETFEGINRQITLHTAASGQALEDLKQRADALVGSLDSSTASLGTDMATLETRLRMGPGQALDDLTRHVEMLRDRFGNINVGAFAGAMRNLGVDGAQADDTLASLVATSQRYSVQLPDLVNNLAGFSSTLRDLHLTAEQAGDMMGQMEANSVPAEKGIAGLETAMKEAAKQGEDFQTFIDRAARSIEYYAQTGQTAAAQALSVDIFGQRKWEQSAQAVHDYLNVVRQGPDAFRGHGAALDDLQKQTQTLDNRWAEVKNKVDAALAPVALNVVDDVSGKMDDFVGFLDAHRQDLASFFGTAIADIGMVVRGVGEVAGFLGRFPILIDAATVALAAFAAVKAFGVVSSGVQALLAGFDTVTLWFLGAPAEASASAAGVDAAMAEMASGTTAAGAEMTGAIAPVATELGVAVPTAAATASTAITTSMTEADAAVLALNSSFDALLATLGAIAGAAAIAGTALALVNLHGDSGPSPHQGGDHDPAGPGSQDAKDTQAKKDAGQKYADAHGGQMPPGYTQWLDKGGPTPPGMAPYYTPGPTPSTPFFDNQGRPLNADGTPVGGGGAPNPTPYTPGMPKTQSQFGIPGAPAAPGTPGTGAPPGSAPGDLLTPDMFEPHKKGPKGPRLPEPPQVPYGPGYGAPPQPGETAELYNAEQKVLEQKHAVAEGQARLNQLEHANTANADDIQKAKNDLLKAEKDANAAELELYQTQTRQLGEHHRQMGHLGAELDKDFGISKGLPGIAENITKFVGNLMMAGPLMALQKMAEGSGGTTGLIAMGLANAGGGGGVPGQPQGPFGGYPGARGGRGAGLPSLGSYPGAVNSPGDLATAGGRVQALYQLADSLQGTPYSTQLRNDCSGMVSELASVAVGLPIPSAGERFSTANEGQWLQSHGFQSGLGGPDDLNIGWHQGGPGGGHTAATLPGGVHAEQGGGTAGDQFTLGPGAAGAENPEFEFKAHLPMGGAAPAGYGNPAGAAPALGGGGPGVTSVYVVNMPGGGVGAPGGGAAAPGGAPGGHGAAPSGFPGGPHGTDTVPLWATPGEKVMNTGASQRFGPLLNAMNGHPQYLAGGGDVDPNIGGAAPDKGIGSGMPGGSGGGAMGAGMAAMGAGPLAGAATFGAATAMAEAQRGIQYAGQMAGVGMEAFTETFLPTGASKLAQNSWLTRIAGGLTGAQVQIPNMAGKATNPAPKGTQAMSPLADPTAFGAMPPPDPTLNAGLGGGGYGAAPAPNVTINAPTPGSVTKDVQPHPGSGLDTHPRHGDGSGGHGNRPSGQGSGRDAPIVHIQEYHAFEKPDSAGADIARHTVAANSPSRGTSQWA